MSRDSRRTPDDRFVVVLVVLAVLKAALMRYFALEDSNPLSAFVLEAALIVIVLGVVDLIPSRRRYLLTLGAYSVLSLLMLVITVYVAFYTQLFDPRMLSMAGQLGTVAGSIRSLIKPAYLLFFIDIPFLAWWAVVLGRADKRRVASAAVAASSDAVASRGTRSRGRSRLPGRSLWVAGAVTVALVVFVGQLVLAAQIPSEVDGVAVARLRGLGVAQASVFLPRGAEGSAQADTIDEELAPLASDVATVTTPAASEPTLPVTPGSKLQARIETIRGAQNGTRIATFPPGEFAGKNLIVIQVEALNTMVMQKKLNGVEITPNLNALLGESWYFPNTYAQTGMGNTADAEFVMNSSLYPPKGQAAPVAYVGKALPALPRLLGQQGYDTFTMHQNTVAYWNRKELYATLGFSRYYDGDFFHWADKFDKKGSSDEVLFKKGGDLLRQVDASSTPFYAQLITLSAHSPFDLIPQARRPMKTPEDLKGSLMGDYITSENYTDFALGKFITQLKADGVWDDSIIVIYGDHTSMNENRLSGKDARAARQLLGRPYSAADRQRVPLIIHLPGQTEPQVVTATAGQVDIMPTIADLVGLDLRSAPHMGRSLFVSSNALVPTRSYLPGGTFANDTVVFMPGVGYKDGRAVSIDSGASVGKTERERADLARVNELSKISDKWILGLPKRPDAPEKLIGGWIPDKAAREAAAPLGATQSGE